MAGVISSVSYMGMLAILLMTMRLKAVDAVTAWDCGGDKLLTTIVKFSDTSDEELVTSLKKLGHKYPDEFAYKFMGAEGYIADMQKDMFYIFKCNPVAAILEPQDKCYDHLPIIINDTKLFLTPWTHVVATKAKEIACEAPYLQYYELELYTYKVMPRPEGSLDPKEVNSETRDPNDPSPIKVLKPSIKLTWNYTEIDNLWTNWTVGILNETEFKSVWDKILHPNTYRGGEGPIVLDNQNFTVLTNHNATKLLFYKINVSQSHIVYIGIASLIVTILCISMLMCC